MEKIESFKINHLQLKPGVYVSRVDEVGDLKVTTYDLRMMQPYKDPVMDTGSIHTIEHLGATWLRNSGFANNVIYFGPMGCRTGFYLILSGSWSSREIVPLVKEMFEFISTYEGEIPGATPHDCGNCIDMSLEGAKVFASLYLHTLKYILEKEDPERLNYHA